MLQEEMRYLTLCTIQVGIASHKIATTFTEN